MKKMNKKTQITMFVILGLILLILAIMFFSFIRQIKPKTTSVVKIIDELETGRLKNHVTSCMSEVGAEGIEKLGANGGVIYDFEGGTIPLQNMEGNYLDYNYLGSDYFVAYGLRKNTACGIIDHSISGYPYPGATFDQFNVIYNENCLYTTSQSGYDGFYGQNVMNKLCYLARQSGCEPFANGPAIGLTLQGQLEDYVAKKLPLCIDFDSFTQRMSANITVNISPVVETNIHDSEILMTVRYPIKISFEDEEPITQIISYQTTLNVRLARIYNFLHNVLLMESKIIDYNPETDFISSVYWKEGIELKRIKAPCTSCDAPSRHDDIIEVSDLNSMVNGKPFIFRTAVENRRPILDIIQNQEINSVNDPLEVPLRAQDPDGSSINYYFLSLGYGKEDCATGGWGGIDLSWTRLDSPCSPTLIGSWCSKNLNIAPGSSSILSIPITGYDYGIHPAGILAVDESGLFDYQMFNISVNLPMPSIAPDTCMSTCASDNYAYAINANHGCRTLPPSFNALGSPYDYDSYCAKWCEIAANPCSGVCLFDTPYSEFSEPCTFCVATIINSEQPNPYDCNQFNYPYLDRLGCIASMPNCFLVLENVSNSFIETCYSIANLNLVYPPAFILTS